MEGKLPLVFYLKASSSPIFGGLHCLAWNFELASRAELIAWRIASLVSAILPVTSVAASPSLKYLATTYVDKKFIPSILAALKPLDHFPEHWWHSVKHPTFSSWPKESGQARLKSANLGSILD
jgi:hypothetical protein